MVGADAARPEPEETLDQDADSETGSRPRRVLVGVIAGAIFAGFVAFLAYALVNDEAVTATSGSQRPGEPAPEFSLASMDGSGTVALGDYLGQPVVVNFWASWCAPCRDEMPHLIDAFRTHGDAGVVFIGIDVQDSIDDANQFVEEFEVPVDDGYILVTDPTGTATISYGVSGLPATFFIDAEGVVVKRWVGDVNRQVLEENIALITA